MKTNIQNPASGICEFAERMENVPRSFIREILKVASSSDIISFAGGLPNPDLFPVDAFADAAVRVLKESGKEALQYSNSEGYLPLRQYIADRYLEQQGLRIAPENILITSGSQQALDLIGKVMLNKGDEVVMEEPGYLGAIQAFSLFQPRFIPVPLRETDMDTENLNRVFQQHDPKLMYVVPDFQNPSGISYGREERQVIVNMLRDRRTLLVEDTPYTDIRFAGERKASFYSLLPEQTILLGSFSKTAVPGFRLGWVVAGNILMEKLIIAKQAADLHTNSFVQRLLYDYLQHHDIDAHITKICKVYGIQCQAMVSALEKLFPAEVKFTRPEGGMFLWVQLQEGQSSMLLFERSLKRKVAFVPGNPFYVRGGEHCSTLRLNFSCSDEATIFEGIGRMANSLKELLPGNKSTV